MDFKAKLSNFHIQIRNHCKKALLDEKRIIVLQSLLASEKMEDEDQSFLKKSADNMTLVDLVRAARFSQKYDAIKILKQAHFQDLLAKFMDEDYLNMDEQFYASFVMANLFCTPSAPPNEQLTYNLMMLLQNADILTIQNCLSLIHNAAQDFPHWRDRVVSENALAEKLSDLFTVEHATKRHLQTLVGVVYRTLDKARPNNSFKTFQKPLCQLVLNLPLEDFDLLKKAMHCFNFLILMFPEDTGKFITKSTIIPRLIDIFFQVNDKVFAYRTLQFIKASLFTMPHIIFDEKVIPLIRELQDRQYEIGTKNMSFCTPKIQLLCYNIIYSALEGQRIESYAFYQSHMAGRMLLVLESTQNEAISQELVRIFKLVLIGNPEIIIKISNIIHQAGQRFPNNSSIMWSIDYIDTLCEHHSCV